MSDIASFLITFRETLEAALIIGIILAYLKHTKQDKYNKIVYLGVAGGVVASLIAAVLFTLIAGGFEGAAEEIFEGVTMLIGAALITSVLFWLLNQKNTIKKIEGGVKRELDEAHKLGLFFVVFVSVLREGVETVIFLGAASIASEGTSLTGALAGIVVSLIFSYLLFAKLVKISMKKVFTVTTILLVLFAAGLVAHGIHELQEAGVVPIYVEHVWDINPALNADGTYPLLHEKGDIGSIFKGLFGYNGDPSLLEIISYIIYLGAIIIINIKKDGRI